MGKYFTANNFLFLVLSLILLNLAYLDLRDYQKMKQAENITAPPNASSDCPNCITKIQDLETKLNIALSNLKISVTPSVTPTPVIINYPIKSAPTVNIAREFYVPFGSGSGAYGDWTDVPGLQAYLDSNSYGTLASVKFEVSLHIPTGNETVSVRLINATDGRVIANSQLDFNGNTDSILLSSPAINLDYGEKLYKVQLKTQLNSPAIIDQSRVHITTK